MRRELNTCPQSPIDLTIQELTSSEKGLSALCLHGNDTDCLPLTQIDPRLRMLIECWGELSELIRAEVETLCHQQPVS